MNSSKLFLDDMKVRMKENPVIKEYLDKMIEDGVEEELALDIMIFTWLSKVKEDG